MPPRPLTPQLNSVEPSLLSPSEYDADATSIRSDQDSDSEDDERQLRARNSRELLAHDRLVLMEEEEMDQLVTETRRKQERERRGSGLPLPVPLRLFSRGAGGASRSRSRSTSPVQVAPATPPQRPQPVSEKRRKRKARRQAKKDRLLADAKHGEDAELMFEMEAGGMKDGSSTGDSSDREDSEEADRRGLLQRAGAQAQGRRTTWRRWLLIHAIIALAFALLALIAWKLSLGRKKASPTQAYVSNGSALFAPTTLLISLDGFRADFLQRGLTPRLNALIREGVSPLYMLPSFPSVTFPNHYTLATGLYPESHGVVGNSFWDPSLEAEFFYTDPNRSMDPKWWRGEPFWVTAEKSGIRTAIHMWPGSEAHIMGPEPSFVDKYNGKEKLANKVKRIFEFLDRPGMEDPTTAVTDMRPQLIAAYVPNVDADGHKYGPNSTEIRATIRAADDMIDQIFRGLEQRNLTQIVNVIVVSDHGMATTDVSRLIQLEDLVDMSKIEHTDGWPLVGLRPKNPGELQSIYEDVLEKTKHNPNVEVYLRDVNMPERYHFSRNERIAPLWIVPKTGWALVQKHEMNVEEAKKSGAVYHPRGLHGYDHEHPLMRAIFIARGPAFPHPPNSRIDVFQNIEVYNILCDSVGIAPMPNNGTLRLPLKPVGLHNSPDTGLDTPPDPVDVSTNTVPPASASSSKPSHSVLVDPVPPADTSSASVPVATPTPIPTGEPGETEEGGDAGENDGEDKHGFWGWLTDKLGVWWNKISGSPKDQPS